MGSGGDTRRPCLFKQHLDENKVRERSYTAHGHLARHLLFRCCESRADRVLGQCRKSGPRRRGVRRGGWSWLRAHPAL